MVIDGGLPDLRGSGRIHPEGTPGATIPEIDGTTVKERA